MSLFISYFNNKILWFFNAVKHFKWYYILEIVILFLIAKKVMSIGIGTHKARVQVHVGPHVSMGSGTITFFKLDYGDEYYSNLHKLSLLSSLIWQ